jgi:hypothetical protein
MANKSKINIKPSKRGTFTKAAKKRGKGVQEFARTVLANKSRYSPAMVKKANFARNASKWDKQDGGPLLDEPINNLDISSAPLETNPLEIAKTLYSEFKRYPDKYEMSGQSYELTPDVYKKYPEFEYVKTLPVQPKRYTTGIDKTSGKEFAYPAYDYDTIIENKAKGGAISPQKAKEMLKNPPHGRQLTDKQKKYFQAIAHGWEPEYEFGGNLMSMGINLTEQLTDTWAGQNDMAMQDMINSGRIDPNAYMKESNTAALKKGIGTGVIGLAQAFLGQRGERKRIEDMATEMQHNRHLNMRLNNLPTAKYGGMLTYDGDSHDDSSGGIPVDKNGNPISITKNHPVAMTEDKEVVWFDPEAEAPYVFSEESGFAKDLRKMSKKYKLNTDQSMAKFDPLLDEAVKKKFTDAKVAQELYNAEKEKSTQMKKGGCLPKKQDGNYIDLPEYIPYGQRDYGSRLKLSPNERFMQTYNIDMPIGLPEFDFASLRSYDALTAPTASAPTIDRVEAPKPLAPRLDNAPIDTSSLVGMEDDIDPNAGVRGTEENPSLSPLGHILSGVGSIAESVALARNKPNKVNLGRMAPERVNYARDRLTMEEDATMARRMNAMAARNAGLNATQTVGTTTTANTGVNRVLGQSRSKSFQDEVNTNAMLRMEANKTNAQLAAEEAAMNAEIENAYRAQRVASNPAAALSRTAASYFADNAAYRRGYDTLRMLAPNARVTRPDDYNTWNWLKGDPYDVGLKYYENTD